MNNIENLDEIITEEQALSFLEQAVRGDKKIQEQQKKESDSFSVFSFSSASEFLTLLQKVVNPKMLAVMGTPDLRGEYFTFSSPFKRLYGMADETPSFQFRWKDGFWFDNTAVAQSLFSEHYPSKRKLENPSSGNIALFLSFFGQGSYPVFTPRDRNNRSAGFSVFQHDKDYYKKCFDDALLAISPEEVHKVVHYIHQECLAAKIMFYEDSHFEALKNRKPLWALRLGDLLKIDTVGYIPREKALVFFYLNGEGNFDLTVKKYNLISGKNDKQFHASIFSLIDGSPAFSEFSKRGFDEESLFFASSSLELSRDRGNLKTTLKKHLVPNERVPSSTVIFAEGEPDAVTLALFGYNAANFKFQTEDGKIKKDAIIREFGVFTDNIIFSDTGDDQKTGFAANFARAMGNLSKEPGRKNSVIYFDTDDFDEGSRFVNVSPEGNKTLVSNVDITDLLTEKLEALKEKVTSFNESTQNMFVEAEIIRLRQKGLQVGYELSSTISYDTVIPLGESPSSTQLRVARLEQLKSVAKVNSPKMIQLLSSSGISGNIANAISETDIEDSVFTTACILPIRLSRQTNTFALRLSQTSFDCSALPAGQQEKGKKCEACPVWAMRQDLEEIDPQLGAYSKANNFQKIPTIIGRTHAGSRYDLRMVPSFASSGNSRRREELQPLNGMTCNPRLPYTVEEDKIYAAQVEINQTVKAVYLYFDSVFLSAQTVNRNVGILQNCIGYFAKIFVRSEDKKLSIIQVFVACAMERSDFDNEASRKRIEKRYSIVKERDKKSIIEEFFPVLLEEKASPAKIMPSVENTEAILYRTLNELFHKMGSFSNIRATLAMFLSSNSGTYARNASGQSYYLGFSVGIYGLPSCGKTHIARTLLHLLSSQNLATGIANVSGIMQAANAKLTTFLPSGTASNKYVAPVPAQHDGDFFVFDEAHGEAIQSKQAFRVFDPLLSLTWDGNAVITGTFAAASAAHTELNVNNAETIDARCPFILLGNLSNRTNSFALVNDTKNPRRDSDTKRVYEKALTVLPNIFGFPDIAAFHKRFLLQWAYPRDSQINSDDYVEFRKKCIGYGIPEEEIVRFDTINLDAPVHSLPEFYRSLFRLFTQYRHTRMSLGVEITFEAEQLAYKFAKDFIEGVVSQSLRIERGYEREGMVRRILGMANTLSLLRLDTQITDKDVILANKLLEFLWRDVQEISGEGINTSDEIKSWVLNPHKNGERGEGLDSPYKFPFMRFLLLDLYDPKKPVFKTYQEIDLMIRQFKGRERYVIAANIVRDIEEHEQLMKGTEPSSEKKSELGNLGAAISAGFTPPKKFETLFGIRAVQDIRTKDFLVSVDYINSLRRVIEVLASSGVIER